MMASFKTSIARFVMIPVALCAVLGAGAPSLAEPARIGGVIQRDYKGATAEHQEIAHRPIFFNNSVHAEEVVKTGYNGATRLELLDHTQLAVGANAEIVLDSFVYDPATATSGGLLRFDVGAFRYVSGESKNKKDLKLATPTATIAIRGTELVIFVADTGRTEINVIEGAITVTACGGGGSLDLEAGESATVAADCRMDRDIARKLPPRFIPVMPRDFATIDEGAVPEGENRQLGGDSEAKGEHAREQGEGNSPGGEAPNGGKARGGGKAPGGKAPGGGKSAGGGSTGGGSTGGGATNGGSTGGGSAATDGGASSNGDATGGQTSGSAGTGGGTRDGGSTSANGAS